MYRLSTTGLYVDTIRPEIELRSRHKIQFSVTKTELTKVMKSPYYRGVICFGRKSSKPLPRSDLKWHNALCTGWVLLGSSFPGFYNPVLLCSCFFLVKCRFISESSGSLILGVGVGFRLFFVFFGCGARSCGYFIPTDVKD